MAIDHERMALRELKTFTDISKIFTLVYIVIVSKIPFPSSERSTRYKKAESAHGICSPNLMEFPFAMFPLLQILKIDTCALGNYLADQAVDQHTSVMQKQQKAKIGISLVPLPLFSSYPCYQPSLLILFSHTSSLYLRSITNRKIKPANCQRFSKNILNHPFNIYFDFLISIMLNWIDFRPFHSFSSIE